MSTAAKISIAIEAQTATLQKGFGEAKTAINQLDANMAGSVAKGMAMFTVGLAAVQTALGALQGAFNAVTQSMAEMTRIQTIADRWGLAADQVNALGLAASMSGVDLDAVNDILKDMSERISEVAVLGTGSAVEALEELGLNAERLNALPTDQKLGAIADAMQKVGNQSDQARIAMAIWADQGANMLTVLREGSAGLNRYAAEADALGMNLGTSREDVAAATNAITRMNKAWGAMVAQIAVAVAPAIATVANALAYMLGTLNKLFNSSETNLDSFAGGYAQAASRVTDVTKEMADEQKKATEEAAKAVEEIRKQGESVTQGLRTPAEVYADALTELKSLVDQGAISWETYRRGVTKAAEELRKTGQLAKDFATPGVGAATRANGAFSAVQAANRAAQDEDRRHRENVSWLRKIHDVIGTSGITLAPEGI